MSTDPHPSPEDVWVLARETPLCWEHVWALLMMSCLDCFQKLYAEPSPPPHPHILCNGLSEPLPGATCLSSSLHPVYLGPVIHHHTRTSLLELRSGWVQTPGWHLLGSSRRSGGWRVRGVGRDGVGAERKQAWRGTLGCRPPATARNVPRQCWPLTPALFSSGSTVPTTPTSRTSSRLWSNWPSP